MLKARLSSRSGSAIKPHRSPQHLNICASNNDRHASLYPCYVTTMTDTMDMTVVQPLSMTIMTEGTTTVMGSFATSRRDDGVGDGRQEDRGLEDPVLTSFWDLVPDIVEVYMRGSAGAGAVGTGAVSSPSVARVEALPDDAPDSIAIPLQSMRFDNKPIRTKVCTLNTASMG